MPSLIKLSAAEIVDLAVIDDSQLTDEVREVLNQATVSSTSLPVVLSDDPDLGGDADPTLTPLEHAPRLVAEKTVSLDAADSDGRAGPGDLLHYTLVLRNLGAGAATGLLLSDPIPAHTNVVPGSVLSSLGTVLNEQPLEVAINELAAGTVATVSFSVRIDQPLANGFEEIVNQSTLTADAQPILLSDDPTLAGSADPTVIAVLTGTPRLLPRKTALLFDDRDGDGLLSPGDGLLFLIEVGNRGDGLATGLRLEDSLPPGTSLEAGSVQTSQGTVLSEQPLIVDLGQLGTGAEATVTLVLRIAEPFPADQLTVVNQARITSAELPLLLTDDPTTSTVDDATVREVFITPTVSLSDSSVSENSGPASFDLLLSTPPNRPLSVAWQTADGTASAGNDYLATNGSSELAAGETAAVVEIEIVDDQLNEHDETFLLQLTAATGAVIGDGAGQATITDQDPPPAITLGDASTLEGDAGATPVGLKLLLSNASGLDIAVDYTTVDGSAIGGEDYRRKSSSLAIAAGETSATLEVEVLGDLKDELDESFAVLVTSASGATVADPSGTIEVIDDDQTRLSVLDRTVTEGDEGSREAAFEVRLSHESDRPVSVDYQTREDTARTGEDFLATQDTLLLEAGRMRAEIAVPVLGDEIFEPLEETFHLDLTHPIGAELATASALGTILDDELCAGPELLRNPGAELPLLGSDLPNEQAQLAVWVQVAGEHWYRREQDPLAAEGAAYFAAGQAETAELSQVVDLSGYSEVIARGELLLAFSGHLRTAEEQPSDTARVVVEYFEEDGNLVLDSFDSGEIVSPSEWLRVEDLRLVPVGTDRVRVRLLSNRLEGDTSDGYFDALSLRVIRQPVVEIDDLRIAEGHSASAVGELSVRLSCAIDRPLSITWETVDGTATSGVDYIEARGTLELASGTVGGVIEVEILGDTEHELHEDFFVELREIEPAGLAVAPQPRGRVSILNDDFCARSPGYWQHHSDLWPLSELALGDQQIDQSGTLALLQYGGSDAASKLARQLITTELNLAVGSDPLDILATVEAAHAFLADWPPGSRPRGPDRAEANRLKDILDAYNNPGCTPVAVLP